MSDIAWDPSDDELDEKWARFESGWDGLLLQDRPQTRHIARLVVICMALVAVGYLVVGLGWVL